MKTIGLLGGMSWESTALYYQVINQQVNRKLGGLSSAKICLQSVDFQEVVSALETSREDLANILIQKAKLVEKGGADCLLICCNTVHKVAEDVEKSIEIPLFHIADITGQELQKDGVKRVGLLGSQFTMRQSFYRKRLLHRFGLEVFVPEVEDRIIIHTIIQDQLCQGSIREQDRQSYLKIIDALVEKGAEAIILGCTEIGLLLSSEDCSLPLYNTMELHAKYAVDWALEQRG